MVPADSNMKLVDGGQTFILTTQEPRVVVTAKRRQSGHKREFHNVTPPLSTQVGGADCQLIFKPQYSTLDRSNPISAASPFIGFYTLFWLGLTIFTIRTFLVSYRTTGRFFGYKILSILRKDLFVLGLTDAVMFAVTFINVFIQKLVYRRYISWNGAGYKLQHVPPLFRITFTGMDFVRANDGDRYGK